MPAANIESFCALAERFSIMVDALRDVISELDVNPVIVSDRAATAVDAVVVGRDRREG